MSSPLQNRGVSHIPRLSASSARSPPNRSSSLITAQLEGPRTSSLTSPRALNLSPRPSASPRNQLPTIVESSPQESPNRSAVEETRHNRSLSNSPASHYVSPSRLNGSLLQSLSSPSNNQVAPALAYHSSPVQKDQSINAVYVYALPDVVDVTASLPLLLTPTAEELGKMSSIQVAISYDAYEIRRLNQLLSERESEVDFLKQRNQFLERCNNSDNERL